MTDLYPWIKAGHIIAVVAWMAGMLYLPRLYVYHATAETGSVQSETFKVMERRLLRGIINPAMLAAWLFGLLLVWQGGWWGVEEGKSFDPFWSPGLWREFCPPFSETFAPSRFRIFAAGR